MKYVPSEREEQIAFMQWSEFIKINIPGIDKRLREYIFHIPNGEFRYKHTAMRLKKMGVMAGVADLFVMIPSQNMNGLFIEMKSTAKYAKTTQAQDGFALKCNDMGYCYIVTKGWDTAREFTIKYLGDKIVHTDPFKRQDQGVIENH